MNKSWNQTSYPVQEIWLGSFWLKGGGNYGTALDVAYDNVALSDKGGLPKPGLTTFTSNSLFYLIDYIDRKQFEP